MVVLRITSCFVTKYKHYAGLKYFVNMFFKFLNEKKNTLILKILKISESLKVEK